MVVPNSFFRSERAMKLRAEGRAEGLAVSILRVLEGRSVAVPESARERVLGCGDPDTLEVWFDRALSVESAEELFADVDR